MLFGYPIAATQNNWIHDCVAHAVQTIHASVEAGVQYAWPNVLPQQYRATLRRRTGLRDRLRAYDETVRDLTQAERDEILVALTNQNRISELVTGATECVTIDALPQGMRHAVTDLFEAAFGLLAEFRVRNEQYDVIYDASPAHVCPFCGMEHFDAKEASREPLDHYLARSRYPFAAANLRNLVPMGHKCNSTYKAAIDILWNGNTRRVAYDPYNHGAVQLSLDNSEPFGGAKDNTPFWNIEFNPNTPAVATWDDVFSIRLRYRRDYLDAQYENLLRRLRDLLRREVVTSDAGLIGWLRKLEDLYGDEGFSDRGFLKSAVFRMLRQHCEAGNERLLAQLRELAPQFGQAAGD